MSHSCVKAFCPATVRICRVMKAVSQLRGECLQCLYESKCWGFSLPASKE